MPSVENIESGDYAVVKYNPAVRPNTSRRQLTGVVITIDYVEFKPATPHTMLYLHTGELGLSESPVYEVQFGQGGVDSRVRTSEREVSYGEAWERLTSVRTSFNWVTANDREQPDLTVSVVPALGNRVYSDSEI